jgi:uncharacterized membrane protein
MTDPATASAAKARQGLAIYFPVLIVTSGIVEWLIVRNGDPMQNHPTLVLVLMWMPAATLWVGESGVLVAATTLIVGLIVYRRWMNHGAPIASTPVPSARLIPS